MSTETRSDSRVHQNGSIPPTCSLEVSVDTPDCCFAKVKKKICGAKNAKGFGLFCGLTSGILYSMCAASVKFINDMNSGQIAFYQRIALAAFALPMVIRSGELVLGHNKSCKYWMLLCGVFDAITDYLAFVSFRYLPLSDATVLTSSVPVFVTIAARIFLKERCGTAQILAIVISVAGVALVAKVPLLLANRTDVYSKESVIGVLACFGSIATECGVYVILRRLQEVPTSVILFNFGCVAAVVNAILTVSFGSFTLTVCGSEQWFIIAVAVFSFLSQMALIKALELENAGPVSVLMAAGDILLAFILDMTLFSDSPDMYTIGGTLLVITSVVTVGFKSYIDQITKKCCRKRSPSQPS